MVRRSFSFSFFLFSFSSLPPQFLLAYRRVRWKARGEEERRRGEEKRERLNRDGDIFLFLLDKTGIFRAGEKEKVWILTP